MEESSLLILKKWSIFYQNFIFPELKCYLFEIKRAKFGSLFSNLELRVLDYNKLSYLKYERLKTKRTYKFVESKPIQSIESLLQNYTSVRNAPSWAAEVCLKHPTGSLIIYRTSISASKTRNSASSRFIENSQWPPLEIGQIQPWVDHNETLSNIRCQLDQTTVNCDNFTLNRHQTRVPNNAKPAKFRPRFSSKIEFTHSRTSGGINENTRKLQAE